ncbi:MAG: dTDP-4-dehydrorhamnose reductase [Bacteroidales bacterium]|nr:dTDP-4-dehydrorhamnose reductase [Bacteroidales bacterium]
MPEKILVTGANGQLGKSLQDISRSCTDSCCFVFTDIGELDITHKGAVMDMLHAEKPDAVINAAAYTAVDRAESDEETAYLLNETAVANLAEAAVATGAFLVHVSTDYVFDGQSSVPYTPDHPVHPLSVYGKSKWAGEQAVRRSQAHAAIVRTEWLYSPYGNNFVKTMLRLADSRDSLRVVNDQTGSPTLAEDLARFILGIISRRQEIAGSETFHFSNRGATTWHGFASEILRLANKNCPLFPIPTKEYPTPAQRPNFSVFDLSKGASFLDMDIPDWKESLRKSMPQILYNYENSII